MIKDRLILAGVRNLKEFGYPTVTKENILTDYVFSQFFLAMLQDNRGSNELINKAIDELIEVCRKTQKKGMK
jgi:hypothetical protein